MKAWHFLRNDRRLRYEDGRAVVDGETYTAPPGDICLRYHGMHGSVKLLDALYYAPGEVICRVDITGEVIKGIDKIAGRHRKILWSYDATGVLKAFARKCALDVVHLWDAPEIVLQYLKTGDEIIKAAACDAARAAARADARAVANAAAAAAWAAADDAARADAARVATRAANAATRADARAANAAARADADAVNAAARDAARDAWVKQERRLCRMIMAGRPQCS